MAVSFGFRAGSLALGSGGGGSEPTLITKNITSNETYNASDDNADGYSSVTVAVPIPEPVLVGKTITESGIYSAKDDNADGYNEVTVNIPVRGDLLKLMENNNMSNRITLSDAVLNSEATKIASYAFYYKWIDYINLQNITEVGEYAFYCANGGGNRTTIRLPNCQTIRQYAFKDYSLSDAAIDVLDLSNVVTVEGYAFQRAKIWTRLVLPKCKTVGNNAFQEAQFGGSGLEAPMLETIGERAFHSDYITPDVELPSVKSIGNYAFDHTSSVNFTIGPNCTYIGNTIFGTMGVTNLFVRATTPPTLAGPFKSGNTGVQHIYVPAASVDLYKAANNWSNYASIIEAIPEA